MLTAGFMHLNVVLPVREGQPWFCGVELYSVDLPFGREEAPNTKIRHFLFSLDRFPFGGGMLFTPDPPFRKLLHDR
jgi:hypothetical protein